MNSLFTFQAGCEPVPSCTMNITIENACQNDWVCRITKRDALYHIVPFVTIGGTASNAEIKIPTGFSMKFTISGYTEYDFTQMSGSTSYVINTPSTGQFSFAMDKVNGNNPCLGNQDLFDFHTKIFGCL